MGGGGLLAPDVADEPRQDAAEQVLEVVLAVDLRHRRHRVEQSYKQVKDELGWADFQVRSDIAIRRHQALVNCAFSFCWAAGPPPPGPAPDSGPERRHRSRSQQPQTHRIIPPAPGWPQTLRAVRSWLTPATTLTRWWQAWSKPTLPAR